MRHCFLYVIFYGFNKYIRIYALCFYEFELRLSISGRPIIIFIGAFQSMSKRIRGNIIISHTYVKLIFERNEFSQVGAKPLLSWDTVSSRLIDIISQWIYKLKTDISFLDDGKPKIYLMM